MSSRSPSPPPPPPARPRWRRRLRRLAIGALGLLAAASIALVVVVIVLRGTRDYEKAAARPALAGGPLVIAHRGASASTLENTVPSYRQALADGADVLELDVHLTADGQVVVSHDADLGRALGVDRAIAGGSLLALRAAVAARHPDAVAAELLPTLDEVLHRFPDARINIELKADSAALARAVAAAIERHGRQDGVVVASFRGDALAAFRAASRGAVATAAAPGEGMRFYLCYLLEVPCRPAFEVLQIPPRVRARWPRIELDSVGFVEFAHRHGVAVHYWTIDDAPTLRRLLELGADGLVTNVPARAVAVRAAWRGATPADEAAP